MKCLSIGEWCLVTELSYGVDTALTNNKMVHRLLNTCFDGLFRNINLKQFDALFKELDFKAMDNINALKITLFYFVDLKVMDDINAYKPLSRMQKRVTKNIG